MGSCVLKVLYKHLGRAGVSTFWFSIPPMFLISPSHDKLGEKMIRITASLLYTPED